MDVTPTYGCLVVRENNDRTETLLLYHEPVGGYGGSYALPARRAREGESPREAAASVLAESTGLVAQPKTLQPLSKQYEQSLKLPEGGVGQIVLQVFVPPTVNGTSHAGDDTTVQWIEVGQKQDGLSDQLVSIIEDGVEAYRAIGES